MNRYVSSASCSSASEIGRTEDKTPLDKTPKRVPMTMEDLAFLVGKESRGEEVDHPIRKDMKTILHDSIQRMVESYVWKYCTSSSVEKTDLFQDCMRKIFSSIGKYDPDKGKFTTWSSYVCFSVLNREYHKRIRWESHMVQGEEVLGSKPNDESSERRALDSDQSMLTQDISETIKFLISKNQKNKHMIVALLGDPSVKGYMLPTNIKISQAAVKAGVSQPTIRNFFQKVVQPCFEKRFLQKVKETI